jgi:hypothetical protein
MTSPQKSVKQFITEMREAGFDFEFKAVSNDGLVVKSKNWKDDNRVYTEIVPLVQLKRIEKNATKAR